jgi:hypothetical protein
MLEEALGRWRALESDGATDMPGAAAAPASYERDPHHPDRYPTGGLVLKQTLRDLPRPDDHPIPQARPDAVNFDYVWFTKEEARRFVPPAPRVGQRLDLPWPLVRRLARFHLLDSVRGETPAWRDAHVASAHLWTEVVAMHPTQDGARVHLRLEGGALTQQAGTWAIRPFRQKWDDLTRGYDCRVLGELVYDTAAERFDRFDLLAVGDRWGGTEHNARHEDLLPAPMGIAFTLAGSSPADRTPPHANLWDYFDLPATPGASAR